MKKNIILSLIASTIIFQNCSFASNEEVETLAKTKYYQGVTDTLMVYHKFLNSPYAFKDQNVYLRGYVVFAKTNSMPIKDIVRAIAIAIKFGENPQFYKLDGQDVVVFGIRDRRPDAKFLADELSMYQIDTGVKQVNGYVRTVPIIGKDFIKYAKSVYEQAIQDYQRKLLNSTSKQDIQQNIDTTNYAQNSAPNMEKEPSQNDCNKKVIIKVNLDKVQVVNRVVTDKFLKKYHVTPNEVKPLNSTEKKNLTPQTVKNKIRRVTRNIKRTQDKPLPLDKLNNFNYLYFYLTEKGAITEGGRLLLNGKLYSEGDTIGKWKIDKIVKDTGVIVVKDNDVNYDVAMPKKGE